MNKTSANFGGDRVLFPESLPFKTDWHGGMEAALKIELKEDLDTLDFIREQTLNAGPRRADLIIRKRTGGFLSNALAENFRTYNLIEYKGPGDYLTESVFYKTLSYIYSLVSEGLPKEPVDPDEVSLTLITHHFPIRLKKRLEKRWGAGFSQRQQGIFDILYYEMPIQIIVLGKLSLEQHPWLETLRHSSLSRAEWDQLAQLYQGHENDALYKNYMNFRILAGMSGKEPDIMCEALYLLFADQLKQREEDGRKEGEAVGRKEGREEGRKEGRKDGEERMSSLCRFLFKENRIKDMERAVSDKAFREALFQEFHL